MTLVLLLPFVAAALSAALGVVNLVRKRPSLATWCFFVGMVVLATESLFTGLGLRASSQPDFLRWLTLAFVAKSFVPAAWLLFSLTYSRGDYPESLARWRALLVVFGVTPVVLSLAFGNHLLIVVPANADGDVVRLGFGAAGRILNLMLLAAFVMILMNLEQTFRSAVGTMRWRIKFVVLGLVVVFGARVYAGAEAILYSAHDLAVFGAESSGLVVGCLLLALAYARTGFAEVQVYPSRAVLRSSLTVVIAGGYLFVVGVLAQLVRRFGGAESFQLQVLFVLLGMAGLATLLLSDRLRQRVQRFVGRHFRQAQHDSVRIWSAFSQRLASVRNQPDLCLTSARLLSETFDVLSVSVWLLDDQKQEIFLGRSTNEQSAAGQPGRIVLAASGACLAALRSKGVPFDLEQVGEAWAEELRALNPGTFPNGGHRWCVPLRSGDQCVGAILLVDRVNGVEYSGEELELLQCIADQVASVLVNLKQADELGRTRELEAFRTMSAFFVHDLKNAAASLNLMLANLPVHFDDPAFRQDALRAVGNTARRIEDMIARLSALRHRPEPHPVEADLNELVGYALDQLGPLAGIETTSDLQPLPKVMLDPEQIRTVVTNLAGNARDAIAPPGLVQVRTAQRGNRVELSVTDNGCGMSAAFVSESLFRPFQSTKKKGLGIGMFQARMIVEMHGGTIEVDSEVGRGTTIRVSLPVGSAK
jgi:putative PEP-CTERM system histidine kinase